MRYASVCSGIEAASLAWEPLGWKPVFFSEVEPFPRAVLAHHWPDVPNLGDMTKIGGRDWRGEVDVLVGGTPCFTSGNMVLSRQRYIPIEEVKVGDKVVSHTGKLCSVTRVGSKDAAIGRLSAVGMPEGVYCTSTHPFLSVNWHKQSTKRNNRYTKVEHCSAPTWTPAKNMPGKQWCARTEFPQVDSGFASTKLREPEGVALAGWYLGDGWVRRWTGKSKKAVMLGLNAAKYARFIETFPDLGHYAAQERTGIKVCICDTLLADWLVQEFGEKAAGKRVPAWVLGHEHRESLLEGYFATDGSRRPNSVTANSVSKSLAYGIATLAQTLGYVGSVAFVKTADTTVIEGRTVNQQDYYQCRVVRQTLSRKSRPRHGYLLRTVQSFEPSGTATVYNIEVEEEHSYIVNGMVVHNCQAFSVAGMRKGLHDDRGNLTLIFAELANDILPDFVVWENVPGVLSDKTNAFGCLLGALAGEDGPLLPPGGKWTNAGYVLGPERAIAWRVLDAQYFGVAQRRRRVFLVACPRNGADPREVLFESEGVRRDSAPCREAGEETARNVVGSINCNTGPGGHDAGNFACNQGVDAGHVIPVVAVPDVAGTMISCGGKTGGFSNSVDHAAGGYIIPTLAFGGNNCSGPIDVATARSSSSSPHGRLDFETETFCVYPILEAGARTGKSTTDTRAGMGVGDVSDPMFTLQSGKQHAVAFHPTQDPISSEDGTTHAVGCGSSGGQASIAVALSLRGREGGGTAELSGECATALRASQGGGDKPHVLTAMQVRRLTPRCCERLQGMPDDHTLIPTLRAKKIERDYYLYLRLHRPELTTEEAYRLSKDGPRYKAIGNSMAVPCMTWIGKRIDEIVKRKNTNG